MSLTEIRQDIRFMIFGDNADTSYADTDLDRNVNSWYKRVLGWILSVNGDWQVNGEYAVATIVSGQREYILPTDILKLNEVYIKSTTGGEYIKATQRDINSVVTYPEDYHPTKPEFDLMDNSIFIYIPENTITDVVDGIKLYYQTNLTELTGTASPNLPEIFVRIISLGAAIDYCVSQEMWNRVKKFENRIFGDGTVRDEKGLKDELMEFFANRSLSKKNILTPKEENFE